MADADRRVFLRETTVQEDFFRFVEHMGYDFVQSLGPEQGMPLQHTYRAVDGGATVRFLIEPIVHLPVLLLWGNLAEDVAKEASDYFDVVNRDDILSMYDPAEQSGQRRKALAFLALLASDGRDQGVVAVLDQAARDRDVEVRLDAIWVMRYAPWPEVISIAERVRREDAEPRVREEAQSFLDGYEKMKREGRLAGDVR